MHSALLENLRRPRLPPRRILLDHLQRCLPRLKLGFQLSYSRPQARVPLLDLGQTSLETGSLSRVRLAVFAQGRVRLAQDVERVDLLEELGMLGC